MRYFEVRKPRIEIVPMIDIMLFLLVFFVMIAINMIPSSGLASHLPQSSTAQPLPHAKVMVEIHSGGRIVLDGREIGLEGLRNALRQIASPETVVTVAGTADAPLQDLTRVMDECRQLGISRIGLATRNVP